MRKFFLLFVILLSACTQEITGNAQTPIIPITSTDIPPTQTLPVIASPVSTAVTYPQPAALPAGPVSMIAIGDSLTQGDQDETGRGYPGRMLELVDQLRKGSTITNFGQSGWSSTALIEGDQGLLGQLERAVAEVQSARASGRSAVVFVWIGSNDLWYLYEFGGDVNDAQENDDLQIFSNNIDIILKELRTTGAEVIIALLDDQSKRPVALQGQAFVEITADELNRMALQVQRYNQVITEKAHEYGALTVDFYNTDIFTNSATLSDDGNHPNAAGYDLIAQKWYEALLTIMP